VTVLSTAPYRRALRSRDLRVTLGVGVLVRLPVFAIGVLATVHVVTTLHGSYAQAGVVTAVATLTVAASGPWRGRLLDRLGLRRVVVPSVLVSIACWSVAPFVSYLPFVALVGIAQLFVIPSFAVTRQAVIAAVSVEDRRTAISLDSAAVELSFIIAPAAAIWAASRWSTSWVMFWVQMLGVVGGIALWIANPRLRAPEEPEAGSASAPWRTWFRIPFVAACLAAAASTVVLAGSDIAIVAAVRGFGQQAAIGVVLALWGLGSLFGGLVYGAWHRSVGAYWLLGGLALATLPLALATSLGALAGLSFVAGLLCAPTITATIDQASRVVPAASRGEAMGWHASFLTAGGAIGAPLAGFAIDHAGKAGAGFATVAMAGLGLSVIGLVTALGRSRRPAAAEPMPVHSDATT
jgi:MFS family permease